MASRKISEKTLELNVCAEMLQCIRSWPGSEKALWVGLTQAEESQEGIDEKLRNGFSLMLQFKAPTPTSRENDHYRFTINERQHQAMKGLAKQYKKAVYYVFPLYCKWKKADQDSPDLAQDTWLVPVSSISLNLPPSLPNTSSRQRQIKVGHGGSPPRITGHSMSVQVDRVITAKAFCQGKLATEDGRDFIHSNGIPAEELRAWLARLGDIDAGDPQSAMLRFRRLNALFLPG